MGVESGDGDARQPRASPRSYNAAVNPAHKPLLAILLLVALSGCVEPNRSPLFVPWCGEDAPARLELYAGTERIDATLNEMVERGWTNVEARANREVAVGDCAVGMTPPVLTADAMEQQQAEMRRTLMAFPFLMMIVAVALIAVGFVYRKARKRPRP